MRTLAEQRLGTKQGLGSSSLQADKLAYLNSSPCNKKRNKFIPARQPCFAAGEGMTSSASAPLV